MIEILKKNGFTEEEMQELTEEGFWVSRIFCVLFSEVEKEKKLNNLKKLKCSLDK